MRLTPEQRTLLLSALRQHMSADIEWARAGEYETFQSEADAASALADEIETLGDDLTISRTEAL